LITIREPSAASSCAENAESDRALLKDTDRDVG
jgi:hypothetical protein